MRIPVLAIVVSSALVMTAAFAQLSSNDSSTQARKHYLPEYSESGDLILPKSFHEGGVYIGSPFTSNGLNGRNPTLWRTRASDA